MPRRRRPLPDAAVVWREFEAAADGVETGKAALVAAVPTARVEGRPLADALSEFERELRVSRDRMDGWHRADHDALWRACRDGIDDALRLAERARLEAPSLDFEGLVDLIGTLIEPLDPFAEAERRLKLPGRRARSRRA